MYEPHSYAELKRHTLGFTRTLLINNRRTKQHTILIEGHKPSEDSLRSQNKNYSFNVVRVADSLIVSKRKIVGMGRSGGQAWVRCTLHETHAQRHDVCDCEHMWNLN